MVKTLATAKVARYSCSNTLRLFLPSSWKRILSTAVRLLLLLKSKQLWIIVWLLRQERLSRKLWDMKELSKV